MDILWLFASVLGGIEGQRLTPSDDLDNITAPGKYFISDANAPAHAPSWANQNTCIEVINFAPGNKRVLQLVFENNYQCLGFRFGDKYSTPNYWTDWHRIYDDGILSDSTILGQLGAALGISRMIDFGSTQASFEQKMATLPTQKLIFGFYSPSDTRLVIGYNLGLYGAFFYVSYGEPSPKGLCYISNGTYTWI